MPVKCKRDYWQLKAPDPRQTDHYVANRLKIDFKENRRTLIKKNNKMMSL